MDWTREIIAIITTCALYAGLFLGVEVWSRMRRPPVELTRKSVHVGGGLIALSFPWLFQSPWTVAALAVPFVGLLLYARRTGMLGSVQGVERITIGEILYPIAIATTLLLASSVDQPALYLCAMLTLAVSDALAGLVGTAAGKRRYRTFGGTRSLEGSATFFVTALLIVWGLLSFLAGWGHTDALVAALLASTIATATEALMPGGFDNLAIPLVVFHVLLHQSDGIITA